MTPQEAMEHLHELSYWVNISQQPDTKEALKLGIAALIFYQKLKTLNTGEIQGNFLGETEE